MKLKTLSFSAALFLLTAIIFIGHGMAKAEDVPFRERLISIDKQDQGFVQALEAIADQAGIAINIHGQIPEGKRDLALDKMPLGQAMAQVLGMYGVRNHAASYNSETGTVVLAILETSTMMAALSPDTRPAIDFWDKPLTDDQLARLREQSAIIVAEMEESALPLAPYQLEQLREQSSAMEREMEEDQPLTPEQLERLREQSWQIEMEMEEASQPLTPEQLQGLREQSAHIEKENEDSMQPLTSEQLQRLRDLERQN